MAHDVRLASVGSYRKAATDDFSPTDQVGIDLVAFYRATRSESETGHDFIDDQESPVFGSDLAKSL